MNSASTRIDNTPENWEQGKLGREEEFVRVSAEGSDEGLDDALDLQLISIRLQKSLIEDFKTIAMFHGGIGYQTLMRQILRRFATSETKQILREIAAEKSKERSAEENLKKETAARDAA